MEKINIILQERIFNRIEKINHYIKLEKAYLQIIKEEVERRNGKKINHRLYRIKKKLYQYENKTLNPNDYYKKLYIIAEEKYLIKYQLKLRVIKQRKLRNHYDDAWLDKEIKSLEKEKIKHLENLKNKYQKIIDNNLSNFLLEESLHLYNQLSNEENLKLKTYEVKLEKNSEMIIRKRTCKSNKKLGKLEIKLNKLNQKLSSIQAKTICYDLGENVVLELKNISMHFGGLKAVDNLSFEVKEGEIFGLIGPNGAGKTTVFNCITQFYKPTTGEVYFRDARKQVICLNNYLVHNVIRHGIVRTFQNVELVWELSILDNLLVAAHSLYQSSLFDQFFHTRFYRKEELVIKEKALKVLEFLNLLPYKDLPPMGLPYGILKRIELARTLMVNPKLIILDEPAAGLNERETEELAQTIKTIQKELNCTIFLVEHDMSLVMNICDTVCAISFGKKLAIGTPEEIQGSKLVQEAYLGGE